MRVLGIDPGIANCGWAVLGDNGEVLDCGVIKTTIKLAHDERITRVYDELYRIASSFQVKQIANERLPYNSKMVSTSGINEVIGVIALLSSRIGVKRIEYSPMTAKKRIAGSAKASKDDVMAEVRRRGWAGDLVEHSADACILAMTFLEQDYVGPS